LYWISKGAKPSDTAHNLLVSEKIIEAEKIKIFNISKKKQAELKKANETPAELEKPSEQPKPEEQKPAEEASPAFAEDSGEAKLEVPPEEKHNN